MSDEDFLINGKSLPEFFRETGEETRYYVMLVVLAVSRKDQSTVDKLVAIRKMETPKEKGREVRLSEIELPATAMHLEDTERACWTGALLHAGLRRDRPQIAALKNLLQRRVAF